MKLFSVSIIIPTHNRARLLVAALKSLAKLDYPKEKLEIVVVDDGSIDETQKEVKKLIKDFPFALWCFYQDKKGISEAKNLGIKNSKGEIVVSTDDDCLFEKDWLKKIIKPFNNPKVGSVGGPDKAYKLDSNLAKAVSFAFSSFIGSGGIHGRVAKVRLGKFYPMGCNMAILRKALGKVGLFELRLQPGEDTDLNHRIERAGYKLVYAPDAFVWHRSRGSFRGLIRRFYKRGFARVEIIRKHREYAELIYFLPALTVIVGVLLLMLSFFSPLFLTILAILSIIYLFLLLTTGFSALFYYRRLYFFFVVPALVASQHLMHGVGFITAVIRLSCQRLSKSLKREER